VKSILHSTLYCQYFAKIVEGSKKSGNKKSHTAAELDALLPALLDRAFKGEL
jgi:hypothetical protein